MSCVHRELCLLTSNPLLKPLRMICCKEKRELGNIKCSRHYRGHWMIQWNEIISNAQRQLAHNTFLMSAAQIFIFWPRQFIQLILSTFLLSLCFFLVFCLHPGVGQRSRTHQHDIQRKLCCCVRSVVTEQPLVCSIPLGEAVTLHTSKIIFI